MFTDREAYSLFGAYTTMAFATPVIGGLLADYFLGIWQAVLIGGALLLIGNLLLSIPFSSTFYLGLAVTVCGIGLFKSNNAVLFGTLYKNNDPRRENGFTLFYMGMNAGALLGPIVYSLIAILYNIHAAFLVSMIGMSIAIFLLLLNKTTLCSKSSIPTKIKKIESLTSYLNFLYYLCILIAILLFVLILKYEHIFMGSLTTIGTISIFSLIAFVFYSHRDERNNILIILVLTIFTLLFFSCSLQTATSLMLFTERVVDRHIFTFEIPSAMFLSLQPTFIVLLGPIVSRFWLKQSYISHETSMPIKIAIGLLLASFAFTLFAMAGIFQGSLILVVAGNLLLSIGELCILPIMMSAISFLLHKKIRGTMMGILFLSIALSSYLASLIAKLTSDSYTIQETVKVNVSTSDTSAGYISIFTNISLIVFIFGLLALIISPYLMKMSHQGMKNNPNKGPVNN